MDESLQRTVIAASQKASELRHETGFWPLIGSRFVDLSTFDAWSLESESTIAQLVALASQPDLRPAAIHLAWDGACLAASMTTIENDIEVSPSETLVCLCIDSLSVDAIDTDAQFRWELDTAASFGDFGRVVRLLRKWRERGMPPNYLEPGLRMLYLLTSPEFQASPLLSGAWDPELQSPLMGEKKGAYYSLYSIVAWADTFSAPAIRNPPKSDNPLSLSERVDRQKLRELRHWVDLTRDSGISKKPLVWAITAWTTYAVGLLDGRSGDLREAGRLFEHLPYLDDDPDPVSSVDWRRLKAATIAYEDAGALADALRTANEWAKADKSPDRQSLRKVAQITIKQGELEKAIPALLKAIEGEEGEVDWRERLIVELGLERLAGTSIERALNAAAANSPFRAQGESLTEWLLPCYSHLTPEARQRLWTGLYALSSREFVNNTDQSAFEVAGQCFGESLALELKGAIFRPFFSEHADLQVPSDGVWSDVRTGRGTLGAMVNALLQTRNPNSRAATLLSGWLSENHRHLMDVLLKNREVLDVVTRLRNRAAHESVTSVDLRKLFDAVSLVLAAVHK